MIVRNLEVVRQNENEIKSEGWISRRYLLKEDGMGFSFHETVIEKGAHLKMWYKNHLEAVFCVKGEGILTDLSTGEKYTIKPGTMYALNKHDKHILEGKTEMIMMCVFNPPLNGKETHDKDGSYKIEK